MSFDIEKWYSKVNTGDVVLDFRGVVTSELITQLLDEAEAKLEGVESNGKMKRKVYNVLVESLQNLFHHSIHNVLNGDITRKYAGFVLKKNPSGFVVSTGNFVENDKIKILKDRINQINSLSKEELKALYKMILNNLEFSEKGGGGLGMIDMAKRTGSKLGYEFFNVDEKYSFYQLNIKIS